MKKQISFLDLRNLHGPLNQELIFSFKKHLNNSNFILGSSVSEFEKKFCKFSNSKYCIGVASGTDALVIALRSIGIKKGDEVITTAHTYFSTVLAISIVGAKPVLVDIEKDTFNINTSKIVKKINKKTKAIICVHMYGNPCDMDEIIRIKKKYNLKLIEDCSQAHGAKYKNIMVGSFGDVSAYSMYPGKNLGGLGDAGCVTTNKKSIYKSTQMLRNLGQFKTHNHQILGLNSRLDSIQASFLSIKLKYLNKWNDKRVKIAKRYINEINNSFLSLPSIPINNKHVFHLFVIQTNNRKKLKKYLDDNKIGYQIHYPKQIYKQKAYYDLKYSDLKETDKIFKKILSIPCHPTLKISEQNKIINVLNKYK